MHIKKQYTEMALLMVVLVTVVVLPQEGVPRKTPPFPCLRGEAAMEARRLGGGGRARNT